MKNDILKDEDIKKVETLKDIKDNSVILPSGKESNIADFFTNVKVDPDNLNKLEEKSLELTSESAAYVNRENVGARDNIDNLTTTPTTADEKELVLKNVSSKIRKTSKESIKLKLAESLDVGTAAHVPLWHSGFWVTIKPMKNREKIKLFLDLADEINSLGKKTHDLIFSNTTFLFAKTILEHLQNRIIDTSLIIPNDKSIIDYIKIQDLNILIWGLLKTMLPKGFDFILQCKNTLKLQEDKTPMCSYTANVKLDISKMLWVDNNKLKNAKIIDNNGNEVEFDTIGHMSKRQSKSVTVDDVIKYQEALEATDGETINVTSNGLNISIEVESPTITRYLEFGELFINNMNETIDELIEDGLLNEKSILTNKEEAEYTILKTIELQTYNHFVKSVTVDGNILSEPNDINDTLEIISNNKDLKQKIKNKIIKYIDDSLIAMVGIPDWTCPLCKTNQADNNGTFRSFIAIDVFMYFFTLMGFQYQQAIEELGMK